MIDSPEISDREIEKKLVFVAKVIDLYGDEYWPIFEGLEGTLKRRKTRHAKLKRRLLNLKE